MDDKDLSMKSASRRVETDRTTPAASRPMQKAIVYGVDLACIRQSLLHLACRILLESGISISASDAPAQAVRLYLRCK